MKINISHDSDINDIEKYLGTYKNLIDINRKNRDTECKNISEIYTDEYIKRYLVTFFKKNIKYNKIKLLLKLANKYRPWLEESYMSVSIDIQTYINKYVYYYRDFSILLNWCKLKSCSQWNKTPYGTYFYIEEYHSLIAYLKNKNLNFIKFVTYDLLKNVISNHII